jgi:hypothetical protein
MALLLLDAIPYPNGDGDLTDERDRFQVPPNGHRCRFAGGRQTGDQGMRQAAQPSPDEPDALLDRFIPAYEIVEERSP